MKTEQIQLYNNTYTVPAEAGGFLVTCPGCGAQLNLYDMYHGLCPWCESGVKKQRNRLIRRKQKAFCRGLLRQKKKNLLSFLCIKPSTGWREAGRGRRNFCSRQWDRSGRLFVLDISWKCCKDWRYSCGTENDFRLYGDLRVLWEGLESVRYS